jgi:hypothetical protein
MAVGLADFGAKNAMKIALCVTLALHSVLPATSTRSNRSGWMAV